jgi:hypothetical protein
MCICILYTQYAYVLSVCGWPRGNRAAVVKRKEEAHRLVRWKEELSNTSIPLDMPKNPRDLQVTYLCIRP